MIALMAFVILLVQRKPLVHAVSFSYALPIGVLTCATYMSALQSLVNGDASVNVTTLRLNFVLSSVIAVLLLGETLTARKVLGVVLCLGAIAVFFLGNRRGERHRARNTGLPWALLACLCMAGIILVLSALSMGDITVVIPISQLSFVFTALLSFLFLKEKMNLAKAAGIFFATRSIVAIG